MFSLTFSRPSPGDFAPLPPAASRATVPEALARLTASLPAPQREELTAAFSESDPVLQGEALLNFALRLEQAGNLVAAAEVYSTIVTGNRLPLQQRAQSRLDALLGRGAFGARAEFLLRNFAQQAAEPSALLAMGAAGAVFRLTRLGILSRLATSANPGYFTSLIGAGRIASLAGFALEAPTFALASRLGGATLGREQDWSLRAVGRDFASSYLVLGGMRVAGWASGAAYRSMAANPDLRSTGELALQTLFQQGGMLGGILLGHRAEEWAGLRPHQDGATTLLDSLALLLQFNVAGRLTHHVFGPRFAAWESELDLQARQLETARFPLPPMGGLHSRFGTLLPMPAAPIPVVAGTGAGRGEGLPRTDILLTTGRGPGPGRIVRRNALPVEARYWLAQVEHQDPEQALGAVAKLEDILRQGEGLNAKQYVSLFQRLAAKTDGNVHGDVIDYILVSLGGLVERVNFNDRGPRALFLDMLRPPRVEDALVSSFYTSWLKNPTLGRGDRAQIVSRVIEAFHSHYNTEAPHDAALSLIVDIRKVPHFESDLFTELAVEAGLFAEGDPPWFNQFEPSVDFVWEMLEDPRVPAVTQLQLLRTMTQGLRDSDLRSDRRVRILDHLEDMAVSESNSLPARTWLQTELPALREEFLENNLDEIRSHPKDFSNYAELGYLLTREYASPDLRGLLSNELLARFRDSSRETMSYDHCIDVALAHVGGPTITPETRFHLWSILFKALGDLHQHMQGSEPFGNHELQLYRRTSTVAAKFPREERSAFAVRWIDRLNDEVPARRFFSATVLQGLAPYLEPNFALRRRLETAARHPRLEVKAAALRILSQFKQLN